MQVAWLIVPWHHFAMHGLLIARECIYCAKSPWYLDGETIGWALFLLVRGIIMCFVHGQRNSGVLHHGDDSGFAPIPSDTDQMCVVFPCLGADWQSVKTGTTLEWVNFADGECPWKFYEWILHRHLYMTKIFYIIQCGNENLLVQVWHSSFAELTKKSMKLAILSLSLSLTQYNITFFCLNSKTLCCDYLQCFN